MRKRWEFNDDALFALGLSWFVAGMVLAAVTTDQGDPKGRGDGSPALWALLLWLGPYGLLILGAVLYSLWRGLTSGKVWFVRRSREPVREDLRTAGK